MAEHLIIKGETKAELYATLLPQLQSLVEGESDIIANMANISACIMDTFHFWWVGFYRVIDSEHLNTFDSIDKEWLEKVAEIVPNPFSAY